MACQPINLGCFAMEQKAPRVDDHCKIQILLKPIGGFSNTLFDQLFDHLTKNDSIRGLVFVLVLNFRH
jgi:hypothetical protein